MSQGASPISPFKGPQQRYISAIGRARQFTPTIQGSVSAGAASYSEQSGVWSQIGNQISVALEIIYSATTGTGNAQIGNLPVPNGGPAIVQLACLAPTVAAGSATLYGYVNPGESVINLEVLDQSTGAVSALALPSSGIFNIQGFYYDQTPA